MKTIWNSVSSVKPSPFGLCGPVLFFIFWRTLLSKSINCTFWFILLRERVDMIYITAENEHTKINFFTIPRLHSFVSYHTKMGSTETNFTFIPQSDRLFIQKNINIYKRMLSELNKEKHWPGNATTQVIDSYRIRFNILEQNHTHIVVAIMQLNAPFIMMCEKILQLHRW